MILEKITIFRFREILTFDSNLSVASSSAGFEEDLRLGLYSHDIVQKQASERERERDCQQGFTRAFSVRVFIIFKECCSNCNRIWMRE